MIEIIKHLTTSVFVDNCPNKCFPKGKYLFDIIINKYVRKSQSGITTSVYPHLLHDTFYEIIFYETRTKKIKGGIFLTNY